MGRIDVHHHFFPDNLDKQTSNAKLGWRTPPGTLPWNPDISLESMDASDTDIAILSLPALSSGSVGEANRALTRERNTYVSQVVETYPNRFGFLASLPFLDDVKGALVEIAYALDVLHADGIAMSSSYGVGPDATYVGDECYDAIWAELHRRQAVVFLHGTQVPSSTPIPHPSLCIPITEVPNETFKAAAHLVVTGRKRKYPGVKVILAHMGGGTPLLASRVAVLSNHMGCKLTPDEILEDFKEFYYETALSAYETSLTALDGFVQPDHILFGTDFPAVSTEMARWFTKNVESHYSPDTDRLEDVMIRNALKLFPRLRQVHSSSA